MQEIISLLPKMAQNYVRPQAPVPMKMMAASGTVPLPPQHLGLLLVCLAHDPEHKVAQKAVDTFMQQPSSILHNMLKNQQLVPPVLDFAAKQLHTREEFLQPILLHKQTPNETVAWLAKRVRGAHLELIAQNQQRQLEHPPLITALLDNADLPNEYRVKMLELALRQKLDTGLSLDDIRKFVSDELLRELGYDVSTPPPVSEPYEESSTQDDLPEFEVEFIDDDSSTQEELPAVAVPLDAGTTQETQRVVVDDEEFELELIEIIEDEPEEAAEPEEPEEPEEEEKLTIEQQILRMNVTEKIKAAMRGNKQIRGMLVTDSNRLVSTAVLKNPRITENEVIKISASRSVSEDVIRSITRNRDWMKLYQVKVNLVKNPKCPQGISMRLLNFLRPNDLKGLVGNKNVPQLISINAKKLLSGKNKKK